MNNNLVHECRSNVKSIHVVIKVESGESKDRDPSDTPSKKKKKKKKNTDPCNNQNHSPTSMSFKVLVTKVIKRVPI